MAAITTNVIAAQHPGLPTSKHRKRYILSPFTSGVSGPTVTYYYVENNGTRGEVFTVDDIPNGAVVVRKSVT